MDAIGHIQLRRPVLAGSAGLVAGMLAASVGVYAWAWLLVIACAVGCIAAMAIFRGRARVAALALFGAFFFSGAAYWQAREAGPPGDALARDAARQSENAIYELEGRIVASDIWLPDRAYITAQLDVDRATRLGETLRISGGTLLRWSEPPFAVQVGDRVRVVGQLSLALAHENPGVSGPEGFYRRRGIHTAMRVYRDAGIVVEGRAPRYNVLAALSRFRGELAHRLAESMPAETLPFVLTIWLGDRRQIDSEVYQSFVKSGTAHILSVSGIHIAIIFVSLRMLMRVLVQRRRPRLIVLLVSVAAFAGMTGAQVATVRATIMIAIYLFAEWFDRDPDAPTALGIAAAIFVVHDPGVLYDVAFQLSFLSVGSLILFDNAIADTLQWLPAALREAVSGTFAVQLLPLPVAIHAFHVIPLAAPFVNLLVIPLTGVVLWLGFLTSVAAFVMPAAAPLFGHALHPAVQAVLWTANAVADTGRAHLRVTSPTLAALAAYAAAMTAVYVASGRPTGRRTAWWAGAALAGVACAALWSPIRPRPEVTILDVGHGDAIFVRAPGGATMVVDSGPRSEYADEGERTVAPFLWANHETKIDVLMISHPDADHSGGARYILEHFRVGSVVLGPAPFPGTLEDEVTAICEERGVPVARLARGDEFALGRARVEVLHPPRSMPPESSENDRSLVARVTWPGMSALLTGDIERAGEAALVATRPDATVLKVPHHGSITSSSEAFVDSVSPSVAVISVAMRGRRTVLSPEVVRRYEERGIEVIRTDVVGGVRIRPGDRGLRIEAARLRRGYVTREDP